VAAACRPGLHLLNGIGSGFSASGSSSNLPNGVGPGMALGSTAGLANGHGRPGDSSSTEEDDLLD